MKTAGQLKKEIIDQVFVSGEPENLISAHNLLFDEAFAEVSKWVVCEQSHQVDVIDACKTHYKCGMTIVSRRRGIIRRVYTLANGEWCDPVFYRQTAWPEPECWSRNILTLPKSGLVTALPQLKLGFQPFDETLNSLCGRSRVGIWAHHQNNLYIAPWIQSNEKLVIEWEGIKKEWGNEDPINEAQDYKKAVKLYFQYGHERDYGDSQEAGRIHNVLGTGTFDEALADLMWQCAEEMKVRNTEPCGQERNRFWKEIQDDAVPETETLTVAQLAMYGTGAPSSTEVANLIKGWAPNAILANGALASNGNYDQRTGSLFHDYIFPYAGAYGAGAASNKFWPAIGGDEYTNLAAYKAFFQLPNNEEWYDVCISPVHFFVLNSYSYATTPVESQRAWLNVKMTLSTAPWKVVVMAMGPGASNGNVDFDFDYVGMGANLVISAEVPIYERYIKSGLNYVINGLGGDTLLPGLPPANGSRQFATLAQHGAGRISATKTSFKYELVGVDGNVLDSLTLTK